MNPQGHSGRRTGLAGAWVAAALAALLGATALVLDLSRAVLGAQRTQDVVDAAALAGALQLPDTVACRQRLEVIVAANRQAMPTWPVSVCPARDVVCYGPGDRVPDWGVLRADESAVSVVGHLDVPYPFAAAFGISGAHITRRATALSWAAAGPEDAPLFAGETRAGIDGIRCSGASLTVRGTIHSNTAVVITGSGHQIDGDLEYRHDCRIDDPDGVRGQIVASTIESYPLAYAWDQFDVGPWDHRYQGDVVADTLPSGRIRVNGSLTLIGNGFRAHDSLWVVTGDIRFLGGGAALDRVTMVAAGTICFNGATERFSCREANLFAMSLAAAQPAIRINGSGSDTWGIIYAPNGQVEYNGGAQEVHHGAVVALTIDINGSGAVFAGLDEHGERGTRRSRLIR